MVGDSPPRKAQHGVGPGFRLTRRLLHRQRPMAVQAGRPSALGRRPDVVPCPSRGCVGLVSLEATADNRHAGVHGRIRLGVKRTLDRIGPSSWKYGRMHVPSTPTIMPRSPAAQRDDLSGRPEIVPQHGDHALDPLSVEAGPGRASEQMGTGTSRWPDSRGSTHGAADPVPILSQARATSCFARGPSTGSWWKSVPKARRLPTRSSGWKRAEPWASASTSLAEEVGPSQPDRRPMT